MLSSDLGPSVERIAGISDLVPGLEVKQGKGTSISYLIHIIVFHAGIWVDFEAILDEISKAK